MQLLLWPVPLALVARLEVFGWSLQSDSIETHGYQAQWRLDGNGEPAWFGSIAGLEDWLSHQEQAVKKEAA